MNFVVMMIEFNEKLNFQRPLGFTAALPHSAETEQWLIIMLKKSKQELE